MGLYRNLHQHLFPGDGDEHGAILLAGVCESDRGLRLVARELYLATDGVDYVPGKRGYRMMKAQFIQSRILRARDKQLAYLAIHNHGGSTSVAFSGPDLESHRRGYPALLDITQNMPVGALVFAESAVAGELWLPNRRTSTLANATIVGHQRLLLLPKPERPARRLEQYDRQSRLFGDKGQELLNRTKVGIVGLGGAGSILAELLGRLGVGEFVLVDPECAEPTNLPRLIGARRSDAKFPKWFPKTLANRLCRPKVHLARRNILRANPGAHVEALYGDFLSSSVAARFTDCDFLFLAADTMAARLLFNAIVHQYGIVGIQVGAKVPVGSDGNVGDVFSVSRMITSDSGCLWCNGLISSRKLQSEAVSNETKEGYSYVDDPEVVAPSVVTLNAIACSHAADEFLFHMTGLKYSTVETEWFRWSSRLAKASYDLPRRGENCIECSMSELSRLGMGDNWQLPTKP